MSAMIEKCSGWCESLEEEYLTHKVGEGYLMSITWEVLKDKWKFSKMENEESSRGQEQYQ